MAKILIIDDDWDFVEDIQTVLESNGYQVMTASSRKEGMKAAAEQKPDLIILDVMMDEMDDGFRVAQDLRKTENNPPIIMLTSVKKVTGLDYGQDAEMVPVDSFLEKPVDPDQLLTKVKELLK